MGIGWPRQRSQLPQVIESSKPQAVQRKVARTRIWIWNVEFGGWASRECGRGTLRREVRIAHNKVRHA